MRGYMKRVKNRRFRYLILEKPKTKKAKCKYKRHLFFSFFLSFVGFSSTLNHKNSYGFTYTFSLCPLPRAKTNKKKVSNE